MKNECSEVVFALLDGAFWLRPFYEEGVYHDPWSGDLAPPKEDIEGGGLMVFDYRLTLPAFLEAMSIRLIVLQVLEPGFRDGYQEEFGNLAARLEGFYSTIRDAIRGIPPPTLQKIFHVYHWHQREALDHPRPLDPFFGPSEWLDKGKLFGAIEAYSKSAAVEAYPWPLPVIYYTEDVAHASGQTVSELRGPDPAGLDLLFRKHAMGTVARWKRVYSAIGLPAVWNILGHLKILAGNPNPWSFDPGSSWSLREVGTMLARKPWVGGPGDAVATWDTVPWEISATLDQSSTASQNGSISVRNLLSMLRVGLPTGLVEAFAS